MGLIIRSINVRIKRAKLRGHSYSTSAASCSIELFRSLHTVRPTVLVLQQIYAPHIKNDSDIRKKLPALREDSDNIFARYIFDRSHTDSKCQVLSHIRGGPSY